MPQLDIINFSITTTQFFIFFILCLVILTVSYLPLFFINIGLIFKISNIILFMLHLLVLSIVYTSYKTCG